MAKLNPQFVIFINSKNKLPLIRPKNVILRQHIRCVCVNQTKLSNFKSNSNKYITVFFLSIFLTQLQLDCETYLKCSGFNGFLAFLPPISIASGMAHSSKGPFTYQLTSRRGGGLAQGIIKVS